VVSRHQLPVIGVILFLHAFSFRRRSG
jgi:hypothetical protein